MNKNCLLMVKTKQKKMCALDFFLQVKYETWIGFRLHKANVNDDSFCPPKKQVNVVNNEFGFSTTSE